MNRLRNVFVVVAGLFVAGVALGGQAETNRGFRVAVELADGSRIIGTPALVSLPVQTTYAKMDIPLGEIVLAKVENDHEHIVLDLVNGDKLKGVLTLAPIKLETVFGDISIGIELIKSLRVYRADTPLSETRKP